MKNEIATCSKCGAPLILLASASSRNVMVTSQCNDPEGHRITVDVDPELEVTAMVRDRGIEQRKMNALNAQRRERRMVKQLTIELDGIWLDKGAHASRGKKLCVME